MNLMNTLVKVLGDLRKNSKIDLVNRKIACNFLTPLTKLGRHFLVTKKIRITYTEIHLAETKREKLIISIQMN